MGNITGRTDWEKVWDKDMDLRSCRKASHAGILYNDRGNDLSQQLDNWLSESEVTHGPARAIIVPHSRYSESGACAAAAYRQVRPDLIKYIFILAPSHHFKYNNFCSLTPFEKCETPLYDLPVDLRFNSELNGGFHFNYINENVDENEYSIEIQLPFIAKIMEKYKNKFKIIPILVGDLTPREEEKYGTILAPCIINPQYLFVISTDFCHWGEKYNYKLNDPSKGVKKSVEWLDKQAMDVIETMNASAFCEYLNKYENNICGRNAISILLNALEKSESDLKMSIKFLNYSQSCTNNEKNEIESIVSFASASLVIEDKSWRGFFKKIFHNINFWK